MSAETEQELSTPEALSFYHRAIESLLRTDVPFLVGGGYAILAHTGIARMTKDLDVFVRPGDVDRTLEQLASAGYQIERTFSHWLAKAFCGDDFIDIIFNSGNGCCPVDDAWFDHAVEGEVLGLSVKLSPPEETIWQKAYIMERERYDGADVIHLLRAHGRTLDWDRLLQRFGPNWRVLFSHLVLFGFVYRDLHSAVPQWLMRELSDRLHEETVHPPREDHICRGLLLSREQYLVDLKTSGYEDPRLPPTGKLTSEQIADWTPVPAPPGQN